MSCLHKLKTHLFKLAEFGSPEEFSAIEVFYILLLYIMGVISGLDHLCFDLNAAVSATVVRKQLNLMLMSMLTCKP